MPTYIIETRVTQRRVYRVTAANPKAASDASVDTLPIVEEDEDSETISITEEKES